LHEVIDLASIARALSRVQRWNGDTIVPWTVLQHTLAGLALIPDTEVVAATYWLLHDSEESLTGDVPMPFKTGEQVVLGDAIRNQILKSLGLPAPDAGAIERIRKMDERLAAAEAQVLCPLKTRQAFPIYDEEAFAIVVSLLDMTPRQAIETYLEAVDKLLSLPTIKALARRA